MLGFKGNRDNDIPLENVTYKSGLVLFSLSHDHLNASPKELRSLTRYQIKESVLPPALDTCLFPCH